MTTASKLLKLGLPSSIGATGIVCLTMHLTNQANADFYSLYSLDIDKRPEVNEEELKPVVPPAPDAPASPSNPSPDSPEPPTPQTNSNPAQIESSQSQSASSGGTYSDQDVREIIKKLMQEMTEKHPKGSAPQKSLGSLHEIISRTTQLKNALENLSRLPESQ